MPLETRDEKDLSAWLAARGVAHEILVAREETPTIDAAARALGIRPDEVVKSVLFVGAGDAVLVLARGGSRVDTKALASLLAGSWRLADAATVLRLTGFAAGTVPPVGHATPLRVVMDEAVRGLETMVAGGGAPRASLRIRTRDVEALVHPLVAVVAR